MKIQYISDIHLETRNNEEIKNFNLSCIYEIHEKLNTNLEDQ